MNMLDPEETQVHPSTPKNIVVIDQNETMPYMNTRTVYPSNALPVWLKGLQSIVASEMFTSMLIHWGTDMHCWIGTEEEEKKLPHARPVPKYVEAEEF
jgi:hypothetical protein